MEYEPNYQVSTDYEYLAKLLRDGKHVVCFVTWDFHQGREDEPLWVTDVCDARFEKGDSCDEYDVFRVGCRGTSFITAWKGSQKYIKGAENLTHDEYFVWCCKQHNLEYIVPTR